MIPCCHYMCDWTTYINQQFFEDSFPDAVWRTQSVFSQLIALTRWREAPCEEVDARRRRLGRAACALLNVGRALWLKEVLRWGYVDLVVSTDDDSSLDNVVIL